MSARDPSSREVEPTPPSPPNRDPRDRLGNFVSQAVRLGGLVVVLNEIFTQDTLRPAALAIAALMIAGAQGLEQFLRSFFGDK
jgi:hypothetical protein